MGSFNISCVMSNQTIKEEDKVYLLPICQSTSYRPVEMEYTDSQGNKSLYQQHSYAKTNCYANAYWENFGPIIQGIYNDYGSFELIENNFNKNNLQILFNNLYQNSLKASEGSNSIHDIPFDMKAIYNPKESYSFQQLEGVWNQMWTAMNKGRIFVMDNKVVKPFTFTTLHDATVQYCLDSYENKDKLVTNIINETYQESIKPLLEKAVVNNQIKEDYLMFLTMILDKLNRLEDLNLCQGSDRGLGYLYTNSIFTRLSQKNKDIKDLFVNYYNKNPEANVVGDKELAILLEEYRPLLEHKIILGAMEYLNIKLAPTSYAGQDYSNEGGNEYLKMIKSVNKKIKEDIKKERKMKY